MSTLETNSIGKYSGNNVSIDDALNLKSYSTSARDALTSVAGDTIYNSDDNKVQVYTGSAWEDLGGLDAFAVEYVIVAGGGAGSGYDGNAGAGGGGGAGGYLSSVIGENSGGGLSSHQVLYLAPSTNYPVSIGGGGSGGAGAPGNRGTESYFNNIVSVGGGGGRGKYTVYPTQALGGSGGGGGNHFNQGSNPNAGARGITGMGYNGGNSTGTTNSGYAAGGGGGGAATDGTGGQGGGGTNGGAGTANTGGGGGGNYTGSSSAVSGGSGGSGVIILLYPDTYTISNTGMTLTETDRGDGYKYAKITAGTGTISFS